nr:protein FAM43A [Anolis sagrei ordinatus]
MRVRRQRRGLRRSPPGEPPLPPAQRQQKEEEEDPRGAPHRPLLPRVLPEAMLPWKRHKAELSSPGPPSPPASPGPSSSSSSGGSGGGAGAALLLRRLFSSSRRRAGQRRRRSFRVSREAPCVPALYLGHAATLQAKGEGCTEAPVGRLWARSQGGRLGVRMRLSVGPQGLRLAPAREGEEEEEGGRLYLLHRVTHCAADARLPRLLSWVYRHEARHKAVLLRCHAALLPKAAQAQALALLLLQTSAAALADFRRLKRRSDARHQRQRLLLLRGGEQNPTLTPLAKATASALGYKPPAGRGRGAPRLGPIPEDPRGEEEEEEEEEEGDRGGTPTPTRDKRLGRLLRGLGALGLGNSSPAQPDTG